MKPKARREEERKVNLKKDYKKRTNNDKYFNISN